MARPGAPFSLHASPFFPASLRSQEDDRVSLSSLAPSDYRTARTSPSPAPSTREFRDYSRVSPAPQSYDIQKQSPRDASRQASESSIISSLESLVDLETPSAADHTTPGPALAQLPKENGPKQSTPPVPIQGNGSARNGPTSSSSPVSSIGSGSQLASSIESSQRQSFETQLKASPIIHDILDRLIRYEYTTREIHRDLGDMRQKVNLLVERTLGANNVQPEFKDPFAPHNAQGRSFSSPMMNGQRPSLGNIAPNQSAPGDDVTSISQRLNTLTSSVGQLLALQTQQIQGPSGVPSTLLGGGVPPHEMGPNGIPPVQHPSLLGHGVPPRAGPGLDMRSSPRPPNMPSRTWSAGTLDLPPRASDPNVGRADHMLRGQRRSSTLLRRDSGTLDGAGEGPLISKWDQLNIAPELLRSLTKFGVGPPNKIQQRALPFLLRGSDIIAQAPPTQERIAAYVIPAIQVAVANISVRQGPTVLMVSTTVDQATQAQRMIRDLGGPIGIRSALGVGATSANSDSSQELRLLHQNMPHILCGTPQKLHALFTAPGGLPGSEVRFLVLDEVDQLIARNLHDFVYAIVKLLPPPRSRPTSGTPIPAGPSPPGQQTVLSVNVDSNGRRLSGLPLDTSANPSPMAVERQTALFSNTVPQDVLNLASAIQLREPVRVLVRRDGNVQTPGETSQNSRGLRQFYLYLPFTAGLSRADAAAIAGGGLGIIGSGRSSNNAETAQAREWKLDALSDLFEDIEVPHAIVHVGGMAALDSVVYKLASRGMEAVPLHGDMNAGAKLAALNKFRGTNSVIMRQASKVLVVYDVQVKNAEVNQVPLIINYDLPKAVEEYAQRVSPAIASNYTRPGVVVNFVTAAGGDVEMLRSIECFYKIKCPEVPMSLSGLL